MKKLILLILPFLLLPALSLAKSYGDYQGAVYLRNYDGDTITFNLPGLHPIIGEKISIRVNGIDTPEIKGKCEKEKYDAQQVREILSKNVIFIRVGLHKLHRAIDLMVYDLWLIHLKPFHLS